MKKRLSTIILILIFLVGLSVLLYPTISDYINSKHQSRAIGNYEKALEDFKQKDISKILKAAENYNERLRNTSGSFYQPDSVGGYETVLDISGTGIMGYISIKKIRVVLPIYHGTNEGILNVAVGHLQGTSLPIGGKSTHCVLVAHRGLPSATLFSNLDKLEIGDTFTITVLDRLLTYEVDQILIVDPQDVKALQIVKGKDYCTLLTCTPYGINTQRLLVRGVRIKNASEKSSILVTAEALEIDPSIVAPIIAVPILLLLLIYLLMRYRRKKW